MEAIEAAIRIAKADPKKTVIDESWYFSFGICSVTSKNKQLFMDIYVIFFWQIFFDDSTRNIASGKAAGLHTVIVSI